MDCDICCEDCGDTCRELIVENMEKEIESLKSRLSIARKALESIKDETCHSETCIAMEACDCYCDAAKRALGQIGEGE